MNGVIQPAQWLLIPSSFSPPIPPHAPPRHPTSKVLLPQMWERLRKSADPGDCAAIMDLVGLIKHCVEYRAG